MVAINIINDAHKLVYLAKAYPEKNITDVQALFYMPTVNMNAAIWYAFDEGYLKVVKREVTIEVESPKKNKKPTLQNVEQDFFEVTGKPDEWKFGEAEQALEDVIEYAFEHVNAEEKDLEEYYLAAQLNGYAPQDILIAIKHLLDRGILHEYQIEDHGNNYIFYTLKRNADKVWGAKQFKENPLTGESNE